MNEKYLQVYKILDKTAPPKIAFLHFTDEFQFLISVILSAQSTDDCVNEVGKVLFKKYPTAKALSEANIDEVKEIIKSTGFYNNKAKNIIACATSIDELGHIPKNIISLTKLNGVGHKTANCVLGFRGEPSVAVDTHVKNVVTRVFNLETNINADKLETIIKKNLEPGYWLRFSNTTNWWGREYCFKRKPNCQECKLKKLCSFYKEVGK